MFGFLVKFLIVAIVLVGAAVLFEFRWTGEELRIRSRFSTHAAKVEKAREEIPDESRKKLKSIIEENTR